MSTTVRVRMVQEMAFGALGGAELFFADIDGDGKPEILAYQGPAVFGARMYAVWPHVAAAFPKSTCLSAFRNDGTHLWTWGEPNPADKPYICHAHESCVAAGDVDGDGRVEVALADGRKVFLLDGLTGKVRAEAEMPEDNFYIVQALGEKTAPGEAALVVKNGEGGYGTWRYGEPLIALDARLKTVWGPVAIPGAGHHILSLDLDGDGRKEYLVGYCAVKPSGKIAWTVDAIDPSRVDADKEHVDYPDVLRLASGRLMLGFAGSNKAYLAEAGGRTAFTHPGPHVQGCALGRFRKDSEFQVAIYNDDGPFVLYDPAGRELWQRPAPLRWPLGCPKAAEGRVFHRNRPIVTFSVQGTPEKPVFSKKTGFFESAGKDFIVFTDGGWPWGLDGDGNIALEFAPPANSRQPERDLPPKARADDLGYGFATQVLDWDGDGVKEAVVYDRRYLWVYRP
ncbi:MAG: hypothetical protein FJ278_08095 [Planctomycetes bacterium]|nr:hypothetical protein [Planctomycetota bacterium]